MDRTVAQIEAEYGQTVVAIVFDGDDAVYDYCFNWETGQTMALEGYTVKAIADDGIVDIATANRLYEYEKECHDDCFGIGE
jgi:hypothetical protein